MSPSFCSRILICGRHPPHLRGVVTGSASPQSRALKAGSAPLVALRLGASGEGGWKGERLAFSASVLGALVSPSGDQGGRRVLDGPAKTAGMASTLP